MGVTMRRREQLDPGGDCAGLARFDPGAGARPLQGGRVNQLKVLSDKIDDVTTVENIVKSFAKPGMSDQDRAKGLWKAIIRYRHQTTPPNEHLAGDWEAHDPVKIFNVYGYCMCCCCSALVEALESRGRARGARANLERAQRSRGSLPAMAGTCSTGR